MDRTPVPVSVRNVWKEFHLGSQYDSLRDAIPNMFKRLVGRDRDNAGNHVGKFWALSDVSFDVRRGEAVGLIGHNGAGKSTVLKLLSKICRQTRGEIKVKGRLAALIEVGAGFHPDLTGRENIFLNGTVMGLTHREIRKNFDSIVAYAGLEKFLDMPVKRYSSGMSVRLGFSVIAHVYPEIMLIDEILAVGDMEFQQKCYKRILDLKACGTTILFVSHNLEAISRLCDRVVLLKEGRTVMDGKPAEAIALYRNQVVSRGRFEKVWTPLGIEMADTFREIQFTSGRLEAVSGEGKNEFKAGDSLRVHLSYFARRGIKNPSITVTLERYDGMVCHEASSLYADFQWEIQAGSGSVTLEYPSLNLAPNTYFITAVLHEGQNPVPMAQLPEPLYFTVTSNRPTRGAILMDHAWRLSEPVGMPSAQESELRISTREA
ncbi:MAG: ABC transporter ATP-binding protein [Candidatus Omnitrophica bacterium]|nr:ABC transporter ATP-binding protein [Candidatus Omnitrophota bacterium]